ncbi:MAG: AMP-binding protein [Acidimicrobiia bacterium]|nr:AMP-binding protein [Acidimicrobiia bacterium]
MTVTAPKPGVVAEVTIPSRLRDWATRAPDGVALREKNLGIWREITFAEYWDAVLTVAHGFLALGLEPGERIAVHSENRSEWVYADVAAVAVRAASMGLYPTNPPAEVQYLLADSGARILIAEDQEQVDKALAVQDQTPDLRHIVYLEPRGIRGRYDDPLLMSWREFIDRGRRHREQHPTAVEDLMAGAEKDDLATLVYTSGTTGPPKGAMLSIANIDFGTSVGMTSDGFVEPAPGPDDLILSYLPLCHVYERLFSVWFGLGTGATVNFAESIDTIQQDLREVQPTIFQSVPRIYEKMYAAALVRAASASRLKKLNYAVWMKAADYIGGVLVKREGSHTPVSRMLAALGSVFLFRALKERLGLRRCRHAISAAAPIAPEILRFFMGIGVPLVEAYGMTENSAIATTNRPGRIKLGTVGETLPGVELRIDDETGEILTRHPGTFVGYWNKPEATAEAIDQEGWLHTGDVGEWVDGTHVKIVDRMKDIIITAGGKNISPSEIENTLKTSPFVGEAVVIGDRRKYLTALIGIDFDVVSSWAQAKGITYTTYQDLTEKPEVRKLIDRVVEETNEKFARVEHLRKFSLLTKELDEDDGELTATQKVKRSAIENRFSDLIEAMY